MLVRLEDDEFRAQYQQAMGAVENAKAYLQQLQNGSRPEEVQQAQHNLDEARATAANDKVTLDRTKELFAQGVVSKQALDDATAKYEADQQRANSLQQSFSAVEDRSARRGDCARQGRTDAGGGHSCLRQVATGCDHDPCAGYRHDS